MSDQDDAIQLDVNDFKDEADQVDTQETTAEESSTPEIKKTEAADDGFDQTEDTPEQETDKSEDTEDKPEESDQTDETDADDKPRAKNSAQERIRSLANENRELRQAIERANAQVYQAATPQDLIDQGTDPAMAEIESFRQEQAIRDYNNQIAQTTTDLNLESQQVLHDFPVFDESSPDYDKDFAQKVQSQYLKVAGIQTDQKTGQIYDVKVLPYEFYQSYVEARDHGLKRGQVSGQKAAEKQLSAVEAPSSTPPKAPRRDAFMEGFDSIK